jgi:hypothetical protein
MTNEELLKKFLVIKDYYGVDALSGFEAALANKKKIDIPDHLHGRRYFEWNAGYDAGIDRKQAKRCLITGRKADGEFWSARRSGWSVNQAKVANQAERNGVIGDVTFDYYDTAIQKEPMRTYVCCI